MSKNTLEAREAKQSWRRQQAHIRKKVLLFLGIAFLNASFNSNRGFAAVSRSLAIPADQSPQVKNNHTHLASKSATAMTALIRGIQDATTLNEISNSTPGLHENRTVVFPEFKRVEGGVIVTKVHGPHQFLLLEQSLCLLTHAYNTRIKPYPYDMVVFTTEDLEPKQEDKVKQLVAPAKLYIVKDNRGLKEEVMALEPAQREKILKRCNVSSPADLHWWSECRDIVVNETVPEKEWPGKHRLAYTWQAYFRGWKLWTHPALAKYQYMLWLDSDGFCSSPWKRDPMAVMVQNELVLFYGNWLGGRSKNPGLQDRVRKAFNTQLCRISKNDGRLYSEVNNKCDAPDTSTPGVHGFFHLSNLDFYRSHLSQRWNKAVLGDCILCREPDDQVAMTVPAALLAPDKSWDMYEHGFRFGIHHNTRIDGKSFGRTHIKSFVRYWNEVGKGNFSEAAACPVTAGS